MDICKLLRSLPLLKNYGKDVDLWIHEFEEVMDLWDIQNPKRRLIFMRECVDYSLKEVIKSIEKIVRINPIHQLKLLRNIWELLKTIKFGS